MKIVRTGAMIALPAMAALLSLPALAETVDFTTTGTFTCGTAVGCSILDSGSEIKVKNNDGSSKNATNTVTETAIGYTYNNLLANSPQAQDISVVEFNGTTTKNGKPGASLTGSTFTLTIDQTACTGCYAPATGSGSLTGSLTGTVYTTGTTAYIDFCPAVGPCNPANYTLNIGGVKYTLDTPNDWAFDNASSSIVQMGITYQAATVTPEPTFMMLSGLGFGLLAFVAYRRRKTA